jgi:hypothetical protein
MVNYPSISLWFWYRKFKRKIETINILYCIIFYQSFSVIYYQSFFSQIKHCGGCFFIKLSNGGINISKLCNYSIQFHDFLANFVHFLDKLKVTKLFVLLNRIASSLNVQTCTCIPKSLVFDKTYVTEFV